MKARYIERASDETKAKYGEGSVWPPAAAWDLGEVMSNGNYYESDEMAVSHGVCGDTPQVSANTRSSSSINSSSSSSSSSGISNVRYNRRIRRDGKERKGGSRVDHCIGDFLLVDHLDYRTLDSVKCLNETDG